MRKDEREAAGVTQYNAIVEQDLKLMLDALVKVMDVRSQGGLLKEFVNMVRIHKPEAYKRAQEIVKVLSK